MRSWASINLNTWLSVQDGVQSGNSWQIPMTEFLRLARVYRGRQAAGSSTCNCCRCKRSRVLFLTVNRGLLVYAPAKKARTVPSPLNLAHWLRTCLGTTMSLCLRTDGAKDFGSFVGAGINSSHLFPSRFDSVVGDRRGGRRRRGRLQRRAHAPLLSRSRACRDMLGWCSPPSIKVAHVEQPGPGGDARLPARRPRR